MILYCCFTILFIYDHLSYHFYNPNAAYRQKKVLPQKADDNLDMISLYRLSKKYSHLRPQIQLNS